MTRIDSVRAASDTARESVLQAAEVVAPYVGTARHQAAHYTHEARARLAPKMSRAAEQALSTAREQYGARLHPRLESARGALPPKVDLAAQKAAVRTRRAARQAADYTVPRVEQAVAEAYAAAQPAREEAAVRRAAALAALRGQVTPAEIQKLAKQRQRRARNGRVAKRLLVLGLLAGGAVAAWKWWDKQVNPDWLVEPPAATELGDRVPLASMGDRSVLDPEVEAKQAEAESGATESGVAEAAEHDERR